MFNFAFGIVFNLFTLFYIRLDDEKDWELVSTESSRSGPVLGQLYIRIVQAHIDQPLGTDLGSIRADVALTKIQGLAASGSTNGIYNTNEPRWNHDFLFGTVSDDAPLNISIMSSSMTDPVAKFSIPLSTLSVGQVDDTWHPSDDGILPAKIRVILCFTPHLPHALASSPPLIDVKSIGVRVPRPFDSESSRLLALNLAPFQLHLDRDFLFPEETLSGILSFSARNGPAFIHTAPDIRVIGTETVWLHVQHPYNGQIKEFEQKSLLNERRFCPLPSSNAVSSGETFCWTFSFKLPPLLAPSFTRIHKEIVAYKIRASIVLEPGGPANTYTIDAPFRIGGPIPSHLQREKPKTHSFYFEKDAATGVRMTAAQNPPNGSFASIHISLPPGGCLSIGQENSVSIRIDAGEEPPAPAEPQNPPTDSLTLSGNRPASPVSSDTSPASPPPLRQSGGNKPKPLEFKILRYKLRYRGHLISSNWNDSVKYILPIAGGPPKFLHEITNLAQYHSEHEHEAMSGEISDISVPLRGGNHEFVTMLNLKDGLLPSVSSDVSANVQILWSLHIELKFGSHSPEAVMPVLLALPPSTPFRPASAYPEGQRILDIKFVKNLISIPVAYPIASGDRWKVLSGTTWNLEAPLPNIAASSVEMVTPQDNPAEASQGDTPDA